ncbi:spherulation-specific family 4 protein [Desulfurobacterium sp.]
MVFLSMLLSIFTIIVASCGISGDEAPMHKVIIPAYFYPTDSNWESVLSVSSNLSPLIILNPDAEGGPGSREDPLYTQLINQLNDRGFVPIGYVYTSYSSRPLYEVESDIKTWIELYPGIKGFFIDEVTNSNDTFSINYYRDVFNFIKSIGNYYVVLNPGTQPSREYFSFADNIVVFEGDYDLFKNYGCSSPYPEKSSCIIYGADETEMENAVYSSDVLYLYVTDDDDSYPFDRLPAYWSKELELFK